MFRFTEACLRASKGEIPAGADGKRPTRIDVFENRFVERWLAQAHPITPGLWFGWLVVLGLVVAFERFPWWVGLAHFFGGTLLVTLTEYVLHRWLFHREPRTENERLQHFLLHGYHHEFPNDSKRLVLPPIGIWPVAVVVALVLKLTMGEAWLPVLGGASLGYIAYEWTHYFTHHMNPTRGPLRWVKKYHMQHHFDSPEHRFGITSPIWDAAFGTYLPPGVSWRARQKRRAAVADRAPG